MNHGVCKVDENYTGRGQVGRDSIPQQPRPLESGAIPDLIAVIKVVHEQLDRLTARLEPVLNPECPSTVRAGAEGRSSLRCMVHDIGIVSERISALMERVDL